MSVATTFAQREGASQVIAESAAQPGCFVVGPARGWHPAPDRWVVRAKVADADLALTVIDGWEPPAESTT